MHRPLSLSTHRRPTPPGEILLREFLEPLEMTQLVAGIKPVRRAA